MIPPYEFPNDAVPYATMNTHGHREGRAERLKCKQKHLWPCCNLIIWERGGKVALNIFYQSFSRAHNTHTYLLTVTSFLSLTHTHSNILSQHPQIRLHVTFPIKGFLERLNPQRGDIPASGVKHRLTFLCASSERWLAGGSATLSPDFHKIRGSQLQMWHARICTHSRTRPATPMQPHAHPETDFSRLKSSQWQELPSCFFSNIGWEGPCQRMLSSPANPLLRQRQRDRDNRWTQRELIKILISLSKEAQATEGTQPK